MVIMFHKLMEYRKTHETSGICFCHSGYHTFILPRKRFELILSSRKRHVKFVIHHGFNQGSCEVVVHEGIGVDLRLLERFVLEARAQLVTNDPEVGDTLERTLT